MLQFCISNVLSHLLFCESFPNTPGNSEQCYRPPYVSDDCDFVFYVRNHFTSIFARKNDVFHKDLELLFERLEVRRIDLNLLYSSKQHHDLVVSKQFRCQRFLTLHHPTDIAIVLSEVLVSILFNEIISIVNGISEWCVFDINSRKKKRDMFLTVGADFIRRFIFSVCKLLRADTFVEMFRDSMRYVHYSVDTLKIVNWHCINYSSSIIEKQQQQ